MKRYIKIFLINIFLLLLVLILAEIFSFYKLHERDKNFHYIFNEKTFDFMYDNGWFKKEFRPVLYADNKKGSIIVFGCCMAYNVADDLPEGAPSYYFHKLMKRTVYNRSMPGWGLQHMYFQLNRPEFPSEIDVAPEYIVYIIIRDHYRRLFSNSSANEPHYLRYNIKKGKLVKVDESILNRSLLVYLIKSLYCDNHYNSKLVDFYLTESYKKAKSIWPDVKFIVLDMDEIDEIKGDKVLKENNIKVINIPKYSFGKTIHELKDYWGDDSGHPNRKYWDLVFPGIIKEIESKKS